MNNDYDDLLKKGIPSCRWTNYGPEKTFISSIHDITEDGLQKIQHINLNDQNEVCSLIKNRELVLVMVTTEIEIPGNVKTQVFVKPLMLNSSFTVVNVIERKGYQVTYYGNVLDSGRNRIINGKYWFSPLLFGL